MAHIVNFYAGIRLDRAGMRRGETAWIAERLADAAALVIPVWRSRNLVAGLPEQARAAHIRVGQARELGADADDFILLGMRDGTALFAADLSGIEEPEAHAPLAQAGSFTDLRAVGMLAAPEDAALLAYARALAWWHHRHRFCGVCGSPTRSEQAGHVRRCTDPACATPHFPRTDPAVIMLVHDGGERALLGRQPRFLPGMYSTLAGFVEPGESLEEAVAREVLEEADVVVEAVRYHSSQPWPFPGSIMLGFTARAAEGSVSDAVRFDPVELEDARWFTRDEIRAFADDGPLRLPRRESIARRLVEDWLSGV